MQSTTKRKRVAVYRCKRHQRHHTDEADAEVCEEQLKHHRHFVVENPAGSYLYRTQSFMKLWNTGKVFSINFPQCMLGLTVRGDPILKNTTLWWSSWILLEPFEGITCRRAHHGHLEGGNRTKIVQVWPVAMCNRMIAGTLKVMKADKKSANP